MAKNLEKKSKKKQWGILFVFVIISIVGIIGALVYHRLDDETKEVEESVNDCFSSLKSINIEQVNIYVDYEELIKSLDTIIIENREEEVSSLEKELFKTLEWKIEEIKVEDSNAIVTVETKNKDLKTVVIKWLQQLATLKNAGEAINNQIALEELKKTLANENKTEKTKKDIILKKDNGTWKLELNENLRTLVYPGVEDIASVINNY